MTAVARSTPAAEAHRWAGERSLLVFDDKIYVRAGDSYSCSEAHALFQMEMGRHFKSVTLCARLREGESCGAYAATRANVRVSGLPYYPRVADLFLHPITYYARAWKSLRREIDRHDVVWLAWPHPLSLAAIAYLAALGGPPRYFLVVREDFPEMVRYRYEGPAGVAAVLAARAIVAIGTRLARDPIVFAVGDVMVARYRERFRRVHPIVFPLLQVSDCEGGAGHWRRAGGALRLVVVARLEPEKGLGTLMCALRILANDSVRIELDVVGTGAERARLEAQVKELGLSDRVTFHGYVPFGPELFDLYRKADLFVLPSLTEGVPNVLLEAAAFGLPVVATRVGGIPGYVRDGETGLLVAPDSPHALAEAIAELARNPARRRAMACSARGLGLGATMARQHEVMLDVLAAGIHGAARKAEEATRR